MLLSRAFQLGVHDPWNLTLGELSSAMHGAQEREVTFTRGLVAAAWMNAALARSERMVPLEVLLGDKTERELHEDALRNQREHYEELIAVAVPLTVPPHE